MEAVLDFVRSLRQQIDVIVGVIADRVAFAGNLFEPIDVLLLEHLADDKGVNHAAALSHAPASLDGVVLGRLVEIALFVVPVRVFPVGKIAGHLQVERDGDLCLLRRVGRCSGERATGKCAMRPHRPCCP